VDDQFTSGFDCKQMLTPVARVANNSEILHGMERDCVLDRVISQDAHHLKHVPAVHQGPFVGPLWRSATADHDGGTGKGKTAERQQTGSARSQRYLADKIANTMTFQQTINV
jgi:hypothetical protein